MRPTVRINASGPDYRDTAARLWSADQFSSGGNLTGYGPIGIASTADPELYRTERWGPMSYNIPLSLGRYRVTLYFAENWDFVDAPGIRVFNVDLEASRMLTNFDVFAEAGQRNKAVLKSRDVMVSDGTLNIDFTAVAANPMINAIEVVPID
jgi:hypothetical protein